MVPTITVKLISSLRPSPLDSVQLYPCESKVAKREGVDWSDTLLQPTADGLAQMVVANTSGFTQQLSVGVELGRAVGVTVMDTVDTDLSAEPQLTHSCEVAKIDTSPDPTSRKTKLLEAVGKSELLSAEQAKCLQDFLEDHHQAFSLEPGERGETDMVQMEVDTGDAAPRRQPARRMPFAVRQEVAKQLKTMQASGVIQPSRSPWASPVVMVRKKDGSHRFCIDYRRLNMVTKTDLYPLPRIDDLLDQLGKSRYFSTLDLAAGYWQIRVHPKAIEKKAFITPQGLYEFRAMPFGLTNAPSVFQRLMQRVLMGLNPEEGPDFVSVYIDDVLIFSRTLTEHLQHLKLVIQCLLEAGLKLQPSKCHFVRKEVSLPRAHHHSGGIEAKPTIGLRGQGVPGAPRCSSGTTIPRFELLLPAFHCTVCQDCQAAARTHSQRSRVRLEFRLPDCV